MKRRGEELSVFSTSALDLFASSLGAFILIVLILFPHYRNQGPEEKPAEIQEPIEDRRERAGKIADQLQQAASDQDALRRASAELDSVKSEIKEVKSALAARQAQASAPIKDKQQGATTNMAVEGVEFSILGLETNARRIVILVDLSSSMTNHDRVVRRTVKEIIAPLESRNEFTIIGFRDAGNFVRFRGSGSLATATSANKSEAFRFVDSLLFNGGTGTFSALQSAMSIPADAMILLSDGEPNDAAPQVIVSDITDLNRGRLRRQIHTVAIGDYINDPGLTRFLIELAQRNRGNFVGVQG